MNKVWVHLAGTCCGKTEKWRKVISYGTFLRTRKERFRAAKSIINLIDRNLVVFRPNVSVFIFGTASNRKWGSIFDQYPQSKLSSRFGFSHIVGGNKR